MPPQTKPLLNIYKKIRSNPYTLCIDRRLWKFNVISKRYTFTINDIYRLEWWQQRRWQKIIFTIYLVFWFSLTWWWLSSASLPYGIFLLFSMFDDLENNWLAIEHGLACIETYYSISLCVYFNTHTHTYMDFIHLCFFHARVESSLSGLRLLLSIIYTLIVQANTACLHINLNWLLLLT